MAKDKEKKAPVATTEENVMDQIRQGNLLDEEVIKIGDEEDSKEEKERRVSEYRRAKNQAKYTNLKALLELRDRRREEKATKKWLEDTKKHFDDLCAGKLTPNEYKEKRNEAWEAKRKAFRESDEALQKELGELRNAFPGYWCYEWDR